VVENDGKVTVIDLDTRTEVLQVRDRNGKPVLDRDGKPEAVRIDPKDLNKAQAVYLLQDSLHFYVAVHGPSDPNQNPFGGPWSNLIPGSGIRTFPVNGMFYAIKRDTGEINWHNPVEQQMVILEHFQDMPMVLFTSRYQKWGGGGVNRFPVQACAVKSIDKVTGKLLFDQREIPNGTQFHALNLDLRGGRIDFVGFNMKIIHYLAGAGAEGDGRTGAAGTSGGGQGGLGGAPGGAGGQGGVGGAPGRAGGQGAEAAAIRAKLEAELIRQQVEIELRKQQLEREAIRRAIEKK
jgi:hypothetical protein